LHRHDGDGRPVLVCGRPRAAARRCPHDGHRPPEPHSSYVAAP
jgi:hypothetical protein